MTEILFNILQYESLLQPEEDNIYILINNSLKNSNLLEKIYWKYDLTHIQHDVINTVEFPKE
jgi:hypothetical protein